MQFAHSIWLIAGLAACTILGFGFYHFQKKGQAALQRFAAGHLLEKLTESVSPGRRMTKRIMLIIAVASIFIALALSMFGFFELQLDIYELRRIYNKRISSGKIEE